MMIGTFACAQPPSEPQVSVGSAVLAGGSLTVQFRGEEKTLVQMGKLLEEPDRALRQEVWELVAQRRLAEREQFDDQFETLLKLRERIANFTAPPDGSPGVM